MRIAPLFLVLLAACLQDTAKSSDDSDPNDSLVVDTEDVVDTDLGIDSAVVEVPDAPDTDPPGLPGDRDADGCLDGEDARPDDSAGDLDGDGDPDDCDPCFGEDNHDADGDGLCDDLDADSPPQDTDGDGCIDAVDPLPNQISTDLDGDGVASDCDLCAGDDALGDSDGDGLCGDVDGDDDQDGCLDADDPFPELAAGDLDGDGVGDDCDLCFGPDSADHDGDGLCDSLDADAPPADLDGDGCPDVDDLAPSIASADGDGDSVADDCDACFGDDATGDLDGDGSCDNVDPDDDADGCLDTIDVAPTVAGLDGDGDGVSDHCDLCFGPDNVDSDGDGLCDLLDPTTVLNDADGDGCPDHLDAAPSVASGDSDGDEVPDDCDACEGADGVGDLDLDGICSDVDDDDDGDGCLDVDDAVPSDAGRDLDLDGTSDDCDPCYGPDDVDADGDGVCDSLDESPLGTLQEAAAASGRVIGVAISSWPVVNDPDYTQLLLEQFGSITHEWEAKWHPLQPAEGAWDFVGADAAIGIVAPYGFEVHGHALAWHEAVPDWIDPAITPSAFEALFHTHVETTLAHWDGVIDTWDVVNEAFESDGALRDTLFSQKLGATWVQDTFVAARAAAPDGRLFYNDFGIEGINPKSDAVYAMASQMLADGIPLDGIGFQSHLVVGQGPDRAELDANLARFADLGLAIHLSEADVRMAHVQGGGEARQLAQAMRWYDLTSACVAQPACEKLTVWGVSDAWSWIDAFYGADDPLPFDDDGRPKAAAGAIAAAFRGEPIPDCDAQRVHNGGFEAGLSGWEDRGATLSWVTDARTGNRAVLVSDRTAAWQGPQQSVSARIAEGVTWRATAWARLTAPGSEPLTLTLHRVDDAGDDWTQLSSVTVTEAWTELTGTVALHPDDSTGAVSALELYVEGPAAGIDLLVDDITLVAVCP